MKATPQNPIYTVYAKDKAGTEYNLSEAVTGLTLSESEKELAQKVELTCKNEIIDGWFLSNKIVSGFRLFVYADDGSGRKTVFWGTVWETSASFDVEREVKYTAYDNLIYLQSSKDNLYFSAGTGTNSVISKICGNWGVKLDYQYEEISHPKLPLQGYLADIFIDILDAVKKQRGTRYVIRSTKDVMQVLKFGANQTVYKFSKNDGGVLSSKIEVSLDGMITKVMITGKEGKDKRVPVEATVTGGNMGAYGTLQDMISRPNGTTLAEAKKEAQELLKEKGSPQKTYAVKAPDSPWVRKGDLVYLEGGSAEITGKFYVTSVTHDAVEKTMDLEVSP